MDQPRKNITTGQNHITLNDVHPSIPTLDIYYLLDAQARARVETNAQVPQRSSQTGHSADYHWA